MTHLPVLGNLPADWKVVQFGDVLESHKNGIYKPKEFHGSGTKIVNMGEMFRFNRLSNPDMKRVELTPKEQEAYGLRAGDLLFARRSLVAEGAGKCTLVLESPELRTFESSIIRARPNQLIVVPSFLYYLFSSSYGSYLMNSIVRQTAVAGITGKDLVKLDIPLPPIQVQHKIVSMLKTIDDKIELNHQMNETLEQMAMALYKHWFVDFAPFQDGEFVESELGMIPKGWDIAPLGNVVGVNERSVTKDFPHHYIQYVDISSVEPGRLVGTSVLPLNEAPSRAKRLVQDGDVIWSTVRPNRKSYVLIQTPPDNMVISTGFVVMTPRGIPSSYLYALTTTDQFVEYLVNNADGSAYPAVRADRFDAYKMILPPVSVLNQFDDIVGALFKLAASNNRENVDLEVTRNYLLPRLLSGEIELGEAEAQVEEVLAHG